MARSFASDEQSAPNAEKAPGAGGTTTVGMPISSAISAAWTRGYFRELSPTQLRFVTLLGGMEAPGAGAVHLLELGCGNGYSTSLHAAANPQGRFCGVDFNPTHIHNAQKLAQDAGIENVRFLEKSFAELLQVELEDADFIALHGVWSWVGDEQRQQISSSSAAG